MKHQKYSLTQNIFYYLSKAAESDPYIYLKLILYALIGTIASIVPTIITSFIVHLILTNISMISAASQIILVSLLSGIFIYINSKVNVLVDINSLSLRVGDFTYEINHKFLTMDYEAISNPEIFNLYYRATENSLGSNASGLEAMYRHLVTLLKSLFGIIIFSFIMLHFNPLIVLLIFISAIINIFAMKYTRDYRKKRRNKWADLDTKIRAIKNDTIKVENGKDTRIYNVAPLYLEKIDFVINERLNEHKKESSIILLSDIATLITNIGRNGYTYLYLAGEVIDGLPLPTFTFLFNLMTILDTWVNEFVQSLHDLYLASQDINDYRQFMEYETKKISAPNELPSLTKKPITIEFKNVTFVYPGSDRKILDNISFKINKFEKVALVGINGAGKSTLTKLMMGLLSPTSGEILINNNLISDIPQKQLFDLYAPVFQENEIWALTLEENITLKREDLVNQNKIDSLLLKTDLFNKVDSLQNGIKTNLTRNIAADGVEFSGGESQKLMLTRALYKDAPVLILDEPTAALDALAEQKMYEEYAQFSQNKTSLFISHRLSSTRFCDRIILLSDGKILEQGTHDELLNLKGMYAEMFKTQSQYYKEDTLNETIPQAL